MPRASHCPGQQGHCHSSGRHGLYGEGVYRADWHGHPRPGDVYYTNAPGVGGNHLPDVKAIRPIFFDEQLVAFAVNLGHWADIGGTRREVTIPRRRRFTRRGYISPPCRCFDGKVEPLLLDLIMANVRNRSEREGDLYAQYACNEVAHRRLQGSLHLAWSRHGIAVFAQFLDESDRQMRPPLQRFPTARITVKTTSTTTALSTNL